MNAFEEDSLDVIQWTKDVGGEKIDCASITWKISNFSLRARKADEKITSQEFLCSGAHYILTVYPNGQRAKNSVGKIGLYLERTRNTEKHVVDLKFTIPYKIRKNLCYETHHTFTADDNGWGYPVILCRNKMLRRDKEYLQGDVLTIKCDLSVSRENIPDPEVSSVGAAKIFTGETSSKKKEASTTTLSEDFQEVHLQDDALEEKDEDTTVLCADLETLHKNPRFADVTLKLGDQDIPAHKVILASRSKVFEAMFEHDMQENQQDTVNLVEMELGTVKDMLRYIYCGKVRSLSPEEALKLYVAADRYDLQGLVLKCRKIMLNGLSSDNFCEISAVADLHNDQLLMDAVKTLLRKDAKTLLTTVKWFMFSKENSLLALKLVQSVVLSN